ncbi:MAG: family 1 glycosylhydrolase [Deltaproteobacteria bacterium]|nr:family 1 glycosylhydrolase [Deltaproteobacteria bacterium]
MSRLRFPEGFHWGATTTIRTEGAPREGGRGESIGDRSGRHTRGNGSHGYRRFEEDVALLARLGLTRYRFGIDWSRIQAEGKGAALAAGLDHYAALVDALLAAGIQPAAVLHEGDLPRPLQENGGWATRDTAGRFSDFASCVARRLADRVDVWLPFETPSVFLAEGLLHGRRAPELRDRLAFLKAIHVVNLAQAMAGEALRAEQSDLQLGASIVGAACEPGGDEPCDAKACEEWQVFQEEIFLYPALGLGYPQAFQADEQQRVPELHEQEGDETRCRTQIDFVEVSLAQSVRVVASGDDRLGREAEFEALPFEPDVWPETVCHLLDELSAKPDHPPLEVRGLPCLDAPMPAPDGSLSDESRILQLTCDLEGVAAAITSGANIRGYAAPHFLDAPLGPGDGLAVCGLVAVEAEHGDRTPRASAAWLGRVAQEAGFER